MRTGGIGEVVNTLDCGSNMRGFDSHIPSHLDTVYGTLSIVVFF